MHTTERQLLHAVNAAPQSLDTPSGSPLNITLDSQIHYPSPTPPSAIHFSLHYDRLIHWCHTAEIEPHQLRLGILQDHEHAFSLSSHLHVASIKGTFAVNPFLDIPATLLSPLPHGQTRRNLLLKVGNGGIDVDVYLIGKPTPNAPRWSPTWSYISSSAAAPTIRSTHRPSVGHLLHNTSIQEWFHLPLSFCGLLTVRVAAGDLNNHITLSAALGTHVMILDGDSSSHAYFIGALGSGRSEGDRAEVPVEREGEGAV
ncbi:hypothetical protein MVEN_00767900 [Mycena venus]|uniref:DUF7330 domain-containing protein n=1 Tax=Mycena venus TaxID=2733690 RepID=A0A8H6YLE2_9AGAR|nr:hypothetical protein MVEN_00767900 [Mycena venus]